MAAPEKKVAPAIMNDSMLLQSVLTKKKASAKTVVSKAALAKAKAVLLFLRAAHMKDCMADGWLHARAQ